MDEEGTRPQGYKLSYRLSPAQKLRGKILPLNFAGAGYANQTDTRFGWIYKGHALWPNRQKHCLWYVFTVQTQNYDTLTKARAKRPTHEIDTANSDEGKTSTEMCRYPAGPLI